MIPIPRPTTAACCLALLVAFTACTSFPEVDALQAGPDAPPPALLPLEDILAQAGASRAGTEAGAALAARAARLRARALLMRGPIHDPDTRARLAAAIRTGQA